MLWLGEEGAGPTGSWEVAAKSDLGASKRYPQHAVSAVSGEGVEGLKRALVDRARASLPAPGEAALNARQHALLGEARAALEIYGDPLLQAEALRLARVAFDRLIGRSSTEDMLDALFGRFCIGK